MSGRQTQSGGCVEGCGPGSPASNPQCLQSLPGHVSLPSKLRSNPHKPSATVQVCEGLLRTSELVELDRKALAQHRMCTLPLLPFGLIVILRYFVYLTTFRPSLRWQSVTPGSSLSHFQVYLAGMALHSRAQCVLQGHCLFLHLWSARRRF